MAENAEIFYKRQRAFLNIFSLWPPESGYRRTLHQINFIHVIGFWVLLFDLLVILHILGNLNRMSEVVKAFFVLATSLGVTIKLISIKWYNVELDKLFGSLDDEEFRPQGPKERAIYAAACETSRWQRDGYMFLSLAALGMILIPQLIFEWSHLPLPAYSPFDEDPRKPGYWILYTYLFLGETISCLTNIGFDPLCSSLFIFIKCQLDFVAVRFSKLDHESEDDSTVGEELRKCIRQHMAIVDLTAQVEKLLTKTISLQVFCSVLVLTANFYAIALLSNEKLVLFKFIVYQAAMLAQIFIMCYYAGEVTQRSSELPHELYKTQWVNWSRPNRRILLLFMQRLQSNLRIRTINPSLSFDLMLFSSLLSWL